MSIRVVANIQEGTVTEETLSPQDQAILDSTQTTWTQNRQARDTQFSAIAFDPNDNALDLTKVQAYFQLTNTFLAEAPHTNASVAAQVERNSRAIKALWKLVLGGNG